MSSTETVRTRVTDTVKFGEGVHKGYDEYLPTGEIYPRSLGSYQYPNVLGTQKTVSTGHPFKSRKKQDKGDLGGYFFTQKSFLESKGSSGTIQYGPISLGDYKRFRVYNGPILPMLPNASMFPGSDQSSVGELDALGATAVARCKPTNSVADVSVAIGELLKDGLPHLPGSATWQSRTDHARSAGEEFLNYQFGWLPLVSDVKKFGHAVTHADSILNQYERDAGRVVRRRFSFPIEKEEVETVIDPSTRAYIDPSVDELFFRDNSHLGALSVTVNKSRAVWFSGAFTYALPSGYDSRSKMGRYALEAKKLFGLSLTPETLWNLAPWSWAVDWFSNTGDVISNVSDWITDGLVMRYGYVMEHSRVSHTYSLSDTGRISSCPQVAPLSFVTETKIRQRANPFGFGVSWDGLSPLQLAITAALGITRR